MADLSLDQYIKKKGSAFGNRAGNRGRPKPQKLGLKQSRTQFTVTGVGNVKQRLGVRSKQPDARQKILQNKPDARQKILQKTKFADARARIEHKKAQTKVLDVRTKIENARAKKLDARQLLRARQQKQQQQQTQQQAGVDNKGGTEPRFMVTGLGKVSLTAGPTAHGISAASMHNARSLTKTINTSYPISPSSLSASALAGSIVKTISNENVYEPPPMTKGLRITKTLKIVKPKPVPAPVTYYAEEEDDDMEVYESPPRMERPAPVKTRPIKIPQPSAPVRKQPEVPTADVVAPSQGFRVIISNLYSVVTEEDIIELFGAIGQMKKARLVKQGTAEVIYLSKAHALTAVKKYHQRELDGQPMSVVLMAPSPVKQPKPKPQPPPPAPESEGPLRLGKNTSDSKVGSNVDSSLLHKALFKTTAPREEPSRPVTFTVKI